MFKIVIKGHERKTSLVIPSLLESVSIPILPRGATVTMVLYSTLQKAFTHYFDPHNNLIKSKIRYCCLHFTDEKTVAYKRFSDFLFHGKAFYFKYSSVYMSIPNSQSIPRP